MSRPAPRTPIPTARIKDPVLFLALGFGAGLSPVAPGTLGTLVAVPLYLMLSGLSPDAYLSVVALLTVAGVWLCEQAARRLGVHDHPGIVWDEIAGFLLALSQSPATPAMISAGFVLFRIFDILKPWPIRWFDRNVSGGLGIMLDDILAGLATALILRAITPILD